MQKYKMSFKGQNIYVGIDVHLKRHKGLAPVSRRNKEFGLATANPKERD